MELSEEQKKAVAQWNALGGEITDNTMKQFFESWFANIRRLIRANFVIHSAADIATRLHAEYETFTVLGSGPSIPEILQRLPKNPGAIFCGPTALGALQRYGIRPTALIVADSNPDQYKHLLECDIDPETLDVILPITTSPLWYDEDSVLDHDRLFFYMPYLDWMGQTDLGFNVILKNLVPEAKWWITQAGNVGNLMLNVADMCCGDSESKRIYVAVENSWTKGGPRRAPLRYRPEDHGKELQDFWRLTNDIVRNDLAELPYGPEVLQTDLKSLGYAINLLYIIHTWERDFPFKKERYALLTPASKLYLASSPEVVLPLAAPEEIGNANIHYPREEHWGYKTLLNLINVSNSLQNRLRQDLIDKIIRDWREKPEIQNVIDVPFDDFLFIAKAIHAVEPSIQLRYNGQEVKEDQNGVSE